MGIEDDFYATVKFKNGEEIFGKIAASEEEDRTMIIINNPIIVNKITSRSGASGYKVEPWMKTTTEDMFIVNMNDILTMSESSDIEMILLHQNFVEDLGSNLLNKPKMNRRMGYLSTVNDAKELLEKIFKSS